MQYIQQFVLNKRCFDRPKDAGILRTRIIVTVQGQALQREIDVSATSVDFFVFVIDENGNQSNNFDFGDIYYGQMKELEGFLVNNSPQRYQFKTKFLKGKQTAFVIIFADNLC